MHVLEYVVKLIEFVFNIYILYRGEVVKQLVKVRNDYMGVCDTYTDF